MFTNTKKENDENDLNNIPLNDFSKNPIIEEIEDPTIEEIEALDNEDLATAAKKAVNMVGPRVWEITGFKSEFVKIFVFGCQGSGSKGQDATAQLMKYLASLDENNLPDLLIILGDNLYDYGADNALDDRFWALFEKYYREHFYVDEETTQRKINLLRKIPSLVILGNHDGNYHKKCYLKFPYAQGRPVEENQTAYTFVPKDEEGRPLKKFPDRDEKDKSKTKISDIVKTFLKKVLHLSDLQGWNMPYYFYSFITGDTQLFFLNSNDYVKDFLTSVKGTHDKKRGLNQAEWFKAEYDKAIKAGRKVIICQHHPRKPKNKRAHPKDFDARRYLEQEEINELNKILGTNTQSYNELLNAIHKFQGIEEDMIMAAHDHCMSWFVDDIKKVYQIISGGGGGEKQEQEDFTEQENIGCYLKNNGFVKLTYALNQPTKKLEVLIEFFTTKIPYLGFGHHVVFKNGSAEPFRSPSADKSLEQFRTIMLSACRTFLLETPIRKAKAESNVENEKNKTEFPDIEVLSPMQEKKSTGWGNYFIDGLSSTIATGINTVAHGYKAIKKHIFSEGEIPVESDYIHDIQAYLNQPQLPARKEVQNVMQKIIDLLPDKNAFLEMITKTIAIEEKKIPAEDNEQQTKYFAEAVKMFEELAAPTPSYRPAVNFA